MPKDQTRHLGKLRCHFAVVSVISDDPVCYCRLKQTVYPFYPHKRILAMVRECQDCHIMTVTCVSCGSDITNRARANGKIFYCGHCAKTVLT